MRALKNGDIEIVMDSDLGFIRRSVYEEAVGRSEDLIAKMAQEGALTMRYIATVDGCSLSASSKGGITTAWAKIPGIKISGGFKVVNDGKVITPDFWSRRTAIQLSLPWTAHDAMFLFFVVTMDRPNGNFRMNSAYICGQDVNGNVKGWLKPPLANLYDDGRVCMGHEPVKCCPTIADQWAAALAHFGAAQFNTDLSSSLSQAVVAAQISFDATTNKQLPIPADWWKHWGRINSTVFSVIS